MTVGKYLSILVVVDDDDLHIHYKWKRNLSGIYIDKTAHLNEFTPII